MAAAVRVGDREELRLSAEGVLDRHLSVRVRVEAGRIEVDALVLHDLRRHRDEERPIERAAARGVRDAGILAREALARARLLRLPAALLAALRGRGVAGP